VVNVKKHDDFDENYAEIAGLLAALAAPIDVSVNVGAGGSSGGGSGSSGSSGSTFPPTGPSILGGFGASSRGRGGNSSVSNSWQGGNVTVVINGAAGMNSQMLSRLKNELSRAWGRDIAMSRVLRA
jgi:hypothetical protein